MQIENYIATNVLHRPALSSRDLFGWVRNRIRVSPFPSIAGAHRSRCRGPYIKVLQLRRCRPSGHSQSLRGENKSTKWHSKPWHKPSGHDSFRQYLSSLRTSSTNQANPSLTIFISTRPSSDSYGLSVRLGLINSGKSTIVI